MMKKVNIDALYLETIKFKDLEIFSQGNTSGASFCYFS
jgi:hypothetical protein